MTLESEAAKGPSEKSHHPVWRFVKILLGIVLLVLGVVGLFLPVLQGVLFLLLALAILSSESARVRRFRDALKRRYPGPWEKAEAFKERFFQRFRGKRGERDDDGGP